MNGRIFAVSLGLCLGTLGACKSTGDRPGPYRGAGYGEQQPTPARGEVTVTPGSAAGFLATGYQPLETWMDERFRVRYENMPLKMVFEQKPISDIRYQLQNLPPEAPLFYLVSPSISRRELLKEIANFYRLDMRVEMVNGEPGFVVVTGRGFPSAGGGSYRAESVPPPDAIRPVSGAPLEGSPGVVSGFGREAGSSAPRAVRAVEEGTAVPMPVGESNSSATSPFQVAGPGEVTVEVAGRP